MKGLENLNKLHVGPIARSLWLKYELSKCSGASIVTDRPKLGSNLGRMFRVRYSCGICLKSLIIMIHQQI